MRLRVASLLKPLTLDALFQLLRLLGLASILALATPILSYITGREHHSFLEQGWAELTFCVFSETSGMG